MNSENKEFQLIIHEYLHQIEEKLPVWLSDDTAERRSILDELEEHIWDKAEDLAQGTITKDHIYSAIKSMGTPETITREYRKRGTPYVFISEEWWPIYKKIFQGFGMGFVIIFLISVVRKLIQQGFGWSIFESTLGFWSVFVTVILLLTGIFVGLSWEGLLPSDMKDESKKHRERYYFSEECLTKSDEWKNQKQQFKKEWEDKKAEWKHRKRTHINWKEKLPLNTKELLSNGIWGIIWGILFIIQPFHELNQNFTPAFLAIMVMSGIVSLCGSFVKLGQVFSGMQRVAAQRFFLILTIIVAYCQIPIARDMLADPMALQIFSNTFKWGWDATTVATWILWIAIIGTILEMISLVVKTVIYGYRLNNYNELKAKTTFD